MNANSNVTLSNVATFAVATLDASANAAKFAHRALGLELPLFRALAAEYTRIANASPEGYARVRRALAHQSNALREGCKGATDIAPASHAGMQYVHCIRSNRDGLKAGEYRFAVTEYKKDETKAKAASAKAKASSADSEASEGNGSSATNRKLTNAALDHANEIIADLRAKLATLADANSRLTRERDEARAMLARVNGTPTRAPSRTRKDAPLAAVN